MRLDKRDGRVPAPAAPGRAFSFAVLVVGLSLTLVVAILQQANAKTERQILFNAAVDRVEQSLADTVDTRVQEFRSGVNFLTATHPGPLEEYQAFFSREFDPILEIDPGVLFLEFVDVNDLDELVARERALGNDDITIAALPAPTDQRFILTRLVRPSTVFGRPLLGFDVTLFKNQLIPEEFTEGDFALFIVDSDELTGLVDQAGSRDPQFQQFDDYTAFLVGEVTDPSGEVIGYSVNFQTVSDLMRNVTSQDLEHVGIQIYVEGIEDPVAGNRGTVDLDLDDTELVEVRDVVTSSLRWRIRVWADPEFGSPVGLLVDQIAIWLAGAAISVAAAATARRRSNQRHRLTTAQFELAHARTLAETDTLTGLLNRHGLIDSARHSNAGEPATVFFIDLDGFKAVNDDAGHHEGDRVLSSVAATLRSVFRPEDLVARIGGDEFVVFTEMPGNPDYINAISDRITSAISEIDDRVTCSLGIASRRAGENTDVKDLLRAADTAMYSAKRSGGDRYAINQPG